MTPNLLSALINETNAIEAFSALLGEEQQALVNGTLDALPELTDRKAQAVAKLAELGRERDTCLQALGYDPIKPDIAAMQSIDASLAPAWKALLSAAAEAKRANETNGILIRTRLSYTQQALNVLYGPPESAPLYGPDGRTAPRSGGGSITA